MKKIICFLFTLVMVLGCSNKAIDPINNFGSIALSVDKNNIPQIVNSIKASLSREGFNQITKELLIDQTNASIIVNEIEAGTWSLVVEAFNQEGEVLFTATDQVVIESGKISPLTIILSQNQETGGVFLYITWDENDSWSDFTGNPIITHGNVEHPFVIKDKNFKMWFTEYYNIKGSSRINFVTSEDGLNWNNEITTVLTPGDSGTWDDRHVSVGCVIIEDGIYKLYYQGWSWAEENIHNIGFATSLDGKKWNKFRGNPILSTSEIDAGEDNYSIAVNSIIKQGSKYRLYYSARNFESNNMKTFLALSDDGRIWKKLGTPIMQAELPWENNNRYWPRVNKRNNNWEMYYLGGTPTTYTGFGKATSPDGINWTVASGKPEFNKFNSSVNAEWTTYPMVITESSLSFLYYAARINGTMKICVAIK